MASVVHVVVSPDQDLARAPSPFGALLGVKPIRDALIKVERGE